VSIVTYGILPTQNVFKSHLLNTCRWVISCEGIRFCEVSAAHAQSIGWWRHNSTSRLTVFVTLDIGRYKSRIFSSGLRLSYRPYEIPRISFQPFCSYEMRIDGHHVWRGWIGLGCVRLVTRKRRWSVMSWTFDLTASNNRVLGITKCRELRSRIWRSNLQRNVHNKFHEFPSNHSVVTKFGPRDIAS
jgi:hypothetical protein